MISADLVFPAEENRPPHHAHKRTQPQSKGRRSLSPWGNHLGTNPLGVGTHKEDEPEESRGPRRWPRENQEDAR